MKTTQCEDTLVLVHAIFRHGERTTEKRAIYPKDPYINETYEPYGHGQLTNEGKRTLYMLGNVLRKRYAKFLEEHYYPGLINAWSSDFDRTKASLQLVLAALFKPSNSLIWNHELMWQPIPTYYVPLKQDDMFLPLVSKQFMTLYEENHRASARAKTAFENNKDFIDYLRENTGLEIKTLFDIFIINDVLTTESSFGLELPDWAKPHHKGKIRELAGLQFEVQTESKELKQLAAGKIIGKIVADTEDKMQNNAKCKLHVYSGHDITVGNVLAGLGLIYPHVPGYGACILLEVHKIDNDYVLKVFYREDKTREFTPLVFPDGDFMEFECLKNLANELKPSKSL